MKQSQITLLAIIVVIIALLATMTYLGLEEEQQPYDGDDGGGSPINDDDGGDHLDDTPDNSGLPMAADFTLPLVDEGGLLQLSSLRGKVVVVDFFATWCQPCATQIEYLKDLDGVYSDSEVVIISLDVDDSEGEDLISSYIAQKGITWDVVRGGGSVASMAGYEVQSIPTMVIIDQDGHLVFREVGITSDTILKAEIDKLLP